MTFRARRIALAALTVGILLATVLVMANWTAVRDHLEAKPTGPLDGKGCLVME